MSVTTNDPFDLQRFVAAQADTYALALNELQAGRKRTHWMWYVFPQVAGLGSSVAAQKYAIRSRAEAQAYLEHPTLCGRLRECADVLLQIPGRSAEEIVGYPDVLKLKSSMTLFAAVAQVSASFTAVLDKYYAGERDEYTLWYLRVHA